MGGDVCIGAVFPFDVALVNGGVGGGNVCIGAVDGIDVALAR